MQRVVDLINGGALSVTEDREALVRFMRWVDSWDAENKLPLSPLIAYLERRHPAQGMWDVVRFE